MNIRLLIKRYGRLRPKAKYTIYVEPDGEAVVVPHIMGGKGTTVEAPVPTEQEVELQKMQLAELQKSNEFQELLMPYMMDEMGYRYEVDVDTGEKSITKIPFEERVSHLSPAEQKQYQMQEQLLNQELISFGLNPETGARMTDDERFALMTPQQRSLAELNQEYAERQLKGLRGELEVSPGLERDIKEKRGLLQEDISRRLGPDWRKSTAGIQSMQAFEESADITKEQARQGMLQAGEGMRTSAYGDLFKGRALSGDQYAQTQALLQGGQGGRVGGLQMLSGPNQGYLSGISSAMQPYQQQRGLEFGASQQTAANKAGARAGLMQLAGTAGMAFALSSKDAKENIEPFDGKKALNMVKKGDIYSFDYKEGLGTPGKKIGLIAEEAEEPIRTQDGKHIDMYSQLGLVTAAVKELAGKVDTKKKKRKKKKRTAERRA